MKMKKTKSKVIVTILKLLLSIIVVYNVCFFANTTITQKDYFSIFGISLFCVDTQAMQPDLQKNDFIMVKKDDNEYEENDIIIYKISNQIKIGRIVETKIENEKRYYVVRANTNYYPETIKTEQIIGKKSIVIPFIGLILKIVQNKFITIIIFLILIYNRYRYIRNMQRKRKKRKKQIM